jgi:serine/threonine protein kinase
MQETMTVMLTTRSGLEPQPVEIPGRVGNVRLGEMLGEGGGGAVFSGYDEALGRKVAVKVLHRQVGRTSEASRQELVVGVRSAARVKHPNIVTVHTVDMVGGMPVIVMEFVDGLSLSAMLRRTGAMELPSGLFVMRSVTSAVGALHDAGVIHRDVKPANILFDRDGVAHVCDFGLACTFQTGTAGNEVDTVGGSPLYMAPEVFAGNVSPQGDVYSLGVMLFEVLAGRPPFMADTIEEMRQRHRDDAPPMQILERREVPEDVIALVGRALHKSKILRFKTATHMLRALARLEASGTRDDPLRMQLARIIVAGDGDARREQSAKTDTHSMTTFDMVAERARRKREMRDS